LVSDALIAIAHETCHVPQYTMNYQLHYNKLIARGQRTLIHGYREKHHIIPQCMGGTNSDDNLVWLTAEEHYVAHQLLVKIYPDNHKLIYAAKMMTIGTNKHTRNNKLYAWLRERFAEAVSINNTGRIVTEETKELIREKRKLQTNNKGSKEKGFKHSKATKDKIAAANEGQKRSDERKLNMSIAAKNRLSFSCICCKKEFKHARHFGACIGA
jgi:NUMOD3 motif